MKLYHAISTYQLLEMILYRLKNSSKEESILMITDTLRDKFPNLDDYLEFFKDIWVYEINISFPKGKSFQNVVNEYFNDFFGSRNVHITDFDEINVACCHYYLGHYLVGNNIKFNYFEDAAGMLSRPDILINMEKERKPFKCQKNIEFGLYDGKNNSIHKVICNELAQEKGVLQQYDYIEDFNVIKELLTIGNDQRKMILSTFKELPVLDIKKEVSIILTQHFANLGILEFEEQTDIYKLFVDYFFDKKNVLIKTHPDDVMYYQKIIKCCDIINEKFPAEFLPLIINDNVKEITTISSTSIKNYYGCNYEIFEMNTDFEKTYVSIHKYYVTLALCSYLNLKYETFGCDDFMLDSLVNRNAEELKTRVGKDILIIDDYLNLRFGKTQNEYDNNYLEKVQDLIDKSTYDIIVFVNSRNYHSYFNKDISVFQNIIPIEINIENKLKEWWEIQKSEKNEKQLIYVYVKNSKMRERINSFSMKKHLDNSQKNITVSPMTDYERKAYEGKIKALEERLRYYIELHKDENRR